MTESPLPVDLVQTLWRASGGPLGPVSLTSYPASGNNRVFLATASGQRVVAKLYFSGRGEGLDRLDAEWGFISHVREMGVTAVPQAVARDSAARLALYEFIDGRRLRADDVEAAHVAASARFIPAVGSSKSSTSAPLPRVMPSSNARCCA